MEWLDRQRALLGDMQTEKLKNISVLIFGVGGVGSFVVEGLSRCGIGKISIVDFDTVSLSNINRQIIADTTTVGKKKVDVAKERINKINPACVVDTYDVFVTNENVEEIIYKASPDYVVDAIDNVTAKIAIIEYCVKNNIKIISSMGTGNKLDPSRFRICDISKTSVCPLARVIRHELKVRNITKVDVLFSDEVPVRNTGNTPASISFVPSVAGLMIAGHVVKTVIDSDFIGKDQTF